MAPPYFGHLRYGLYYRDLVLSASDIEGVDPLLLFSLMRQESLFEGFVESTAGARGLMQIIPGTGVDIASELGWPIPFEDQDLYRPDVSIRFGAHYLASNQRALEGDIYAALAAYNSGPGNAVVWRQLANGDQDLFLEIVRFEETRTYFEASGDICIYSHYRTPS
jgi:soluble lytic murein transglycosylase